MSILKKVFETPQLRAVQDLTLKQVNTGLFGLPLIWNTTQTLATDKTALTLSAFYNAIDILSDDIAKLPKNVYQKQGEKREKYTQHYINDLISKRPNPKMTAYTFWKTIETLRLIKGNAFAEIVRNPNTGKALYFDILSNDKVEVFESEQKLYYRYEKRIIEPENMLHFLGFTMDGKVGVGVVTYAATQLGIALENQAYAGTVYKDRGMSYGVLESDQAITNDNKKALSDAFTAKMAEKNVHKAPVLDSGIKYKAISITPAEAQFIETNKQGAIEVARWLNIAPHLIKDLTNGNYSNIQHQSIEHQMISVLPRVVAKEQELDYKLFTDKEKETLYIKFNIAVLLRGDMAAKSQFYTSMVYAGIYTRNEVRELEDRNPIEGLEEPLQPVNMQALSIAMELQKQQIDGTVTSQ